MPFIYLREEGICGLMHIETKQLKEKGKKKSVYMTQDCSCESSYDSTTQCNPKAQGAILGYGAFCFFGDGAEYKFVTEFIYRELTNCVGYLSEFQIFRREPKNWE